MSKLCGIILSSCLVFGNVGLLMDGLKNIFKIFFLFCGSYFFVTICTQIFYNKFDEYFTGDGANSKGEYITIKNIFLIILLCWFPYWCAFFPGILTPDSISQMNQALGVEPLVNHHPIAHTLTEKSILIITKMIGIEDINISVSIISFIQMCIMALIFAYITTCIYKSIRSKLILLLTIIFYAIIPFNAYYSVTLWKDILHAGVVSLLLVLILKIFNQGDDNKQVIYSLYFFFLGCVFCLYRSNGYYAYILWFLPLSIFAYRYRRFSVILVSIMTIVICSYIKGPLYASYGIRNAKYAEGLSIPAQQIAYVIKNNRFLNEHESYYLNKIIDIKKVPGWYQPYISDNIKGNCVNQEFFKNNKLEYLNIWIALGVRYPKDYIIAWINQTRGYWYPNVSYWVYAKGVHKNNLGIKSTPIAFSKILEKISLEKIYFLSPLYNVAIYTWALIIMFVYSAYRKKYKAVVGYCLLLSIFISLLLGTPVYAEFRYYYSVIANLPLILALPFLNKNNIK